MTIKYEALVGHLFIVGGRPINTNPPGAKVQIPPRRAHRSREQDTLFVLITPAGKENAKAAFFEAMADLACDTYFKSRLGVTGALRDAANALNNYVQETNAQQSTDLRAGALLLVKRLEEVYVMRAGSTLCVAQRQSGFETFPGDPEMLNMLPLGARSEPDLEFTHFNLAPNDLFLLGDTGIAALSDDLLREALAKDDIEQVLETLETGVERQAFASLIQFIDPNAPVDAATADAIPEEPQVPNSEPALTEETITGEPTAVLATTPTPEDVATEEVTPMVEAVPATSEPPPLPDDVAGDEPDEAEDNAIDPPVDDPTITAREMPPTNEKPSADDKPKKQGQSLPRLLLMGVLLVISNILRSISNGISAILDRVLPEPEEGAHARQLVPMNLVALVSVIVPAVVAVIVVGVALSERDSTQFEEFRQVALQARDDALAAEDNPSVPPRDRRNNWIDVRYWAQRALAEFNGSEEMRQLVLDAQNQINSYDRIVPTEVTRLREFEPNARLAGPILSDSGQDIYTLDRNRSQVYRDTLDGSGLNVVESYETAIIERGRVINQYLISNIVDIEWITTPGVGQQNALIALDDNGALISYNANFGTSAIQLDTPPEWSRPVAIALWTVNFYVLDAGADQIWRFRPENGFFQNQPEEYFVGNDRPDLSAAVDFGIEEGGDIFILFADGTVSRYQGGEPLAFELNENAAPVEGINNGSALYVNNARGDYALYVADENNDTVYKISLGGTVRGGYRPINLLSDAFNEVSGVFDDPARGNIYILSGSSLYRAERIVE
jgi:hypothetical protein